MIFPDTANKATQFIEICERRVIPLLYLHNVTGFMVGKKYEHEGIIKHGSKMINAVANCELPAISIIMGASYGAGNYAMCGRAYNPRFLFTWPNSKVAVMGTYWTRAARASLTRVICRFRSAGRCDGDHSARCGREVRSQVQRRGRGADEQDVQGQGGQRDYGVLLHE